MNQLFLCCIFAPGHDFFKQNIDFYASRSEWVEAEDGLKAIALYAMRHVKLARGMASRFIKVLRTKELEEGVKDGDSGMDISLGMMVDYYMENRDVV